MQNAPYASMLALLILAGCGDSYDDQVDRLDKHLSSGRIGSSADIWLVKRSYGVDDRVALVFGYLDDFATCLELANMLNARYPSANYTCRPAN